MPREDIHNADDLANLIRTEVRTANVTPTGLMPSGIRRDRTIDPVVNTMLAAIKGTIGQDNQTDFDLVNAHKFNPRITNPMAAAQQTARFRR